MASASGAWPVGNPTQGLSTQALAENHLDALPDRNNPHAIRKESAEEVESFWRYQQKYSHRPVPVQLRLPLRQATRLRPQILLIPKVRW